MITKRSGSKHSIFLLKLLFVFSRDVTLAYSAPSAPSPYQVFVVGVGRHKDETKLSILFASTAYYLLLTGIYCGYPYHFHC